jgi:alkylhydroperoxidase family enzyme
MQHHLASSKRAGLTPQDWQALKDPAAASFADKEKTALAYAEKLTRTPWEVGDNDFAVLKQHFNDAQLVDLHLLVGLINLTNRFTDPLGLELEMAAEKI